MNARERFALNAEQQQRLLALRAAWEEGEDEERLERLRLREEDAEAVRAFDTLLAETDFAAGTRSHVCANGASAFTGPRPRAQSQL